jgi:hypothetical protein
MVLLGKDFPKSIGLTGSGFPYSFGVYFEFVWSENNALASKRCVFCRLAFIQLRKRPRVDPWGSIESAKGIVLSLGLPHFP